MRQLLFVLCAFPLAGCEPSAARENPVDVQPGRYVFDLPMELTPAAMRQNSWQCVYPGLHQKGVPLMLIRLPFETLKDCRVDEPVRKGNLITIKGSCNPPEGVSGDSMEIVGEATIAADGVDGKFEVDTSKLDPNSTNSGKLEELKGLKTFKVFAKRTGEC